jgi:single-stranded DNA-binding protein
MNSVTLSGRVKDVGSLMQTHRTQCDVISFTLKTERRTSGGGTAVDLFKISCYGPAARQVADDLQIGRHIVVSGRLALRTIGSRTECYIALNDYSLASKQLENVPDTEAIPSE